MIVVLNATPLIALAKIDRLELLRRVYTEVYVPEAVYNEVAGIPGKAGAIELTKAKWIKKARVKNRAIVNLLTAELDQGEAEVLVLADQLKADWVVIDEQKGRAAARAAGLQLTGTVGVVLLAKRLGYVDKVKPIFDELAEVHFRLSDKVYRESLRKAGEMELSGT